MADASVFNHFWFCFRDSAYTSDYAKWNYVHKDCTQETLLWMLARSKPATTTTQTVQKIKMLGQTASNSCERSRDAASGSKNSCTLSPSIHIPTNTIHKLTHPLFNSISHSFTRLTSHIKHSVALLKGSSAPVLGDDYFEHLLVASSNVVYLPIMPGALHINSKSKMQRHRPPLFWMHIICPQPRQTEPSSPTRISLRPESSLIVKKWQRIISCIYGSSLLAQYNSTLSFVFIVCSHIISPKSPVYRQCILIFDSHTLALPRTCPWRCCLCTATALDRLCAMVQSKGKTDGTEHIGF